MDTVEGNKLIAEFMGQFAYLNDEHDYHTNWNQLMRVVEKISSLDYEVIILSMSKLVAIETVGGKRKAESNTEESLIKNVWNCVTDFITWYNNTKK